MSDPVPLPAGAWLRPTEKTDAEALLATHLRNREHLRPFGPIRPDSFWTLAAHREQLDELVERRAAGSMLDFLIVRAGAVLGRATLNGIERGPFHSASLGYWVDAGEVRQGLAAAATAAVCRIADEEAGLHRLAASTAVTNVASQRVLAKNGFEKIGLARNYLYLDGRWGDSILFQRILNDRPPGGR